MHSILLRDAEVYAPDVMAMGRWHVRDGKPVVLGTFERETR